MYALQYIANQYDAGQFQVVRLTPALCRTIPGIIVAWTKDFYLFAPQFIPHPVPADFWSSEPTTIESLYYSAKFCQMIELFLAMQDANEQLAEFAKRPSYQVQTLIISRTSQPHLSSFQSCESPEDYASDFAILRSVSIKVSNPDKSLQYQYEIHIYPYQIDIQTEMAKLKSTEVEPLFALEFIEVDDKSAPISPLKSIYKHYPGMPGTDCYVSQSNPCSFPSTMYEFFSLLRSPEIVNLSDLFGFDLASEPFELRIKINEPLPEHIDMTARFACRHIPEDPMHLRSQLSQFALNHIKCDVELKKYLTYDQFGDLNLERKRLLLQAFTAREKKEN